MVAGSGANPNPPCQHSLWEETGVPGKNPTAFGTALTNSSYKCHGSVARIEPTISEVRVTCL